HARDRRAAVSSRRPTSPLVGDAACHVCRLVRGVSAVWIIVPPCDSFDGMGLYGVVAGGSGGRHLYSKIGCRLSVDRAVGLMVLVDGMGSAIVGSGTLCRIGCLVWNALQPGLPADLPFRWPDDNRFDRK